MHTSAVRLQGAAALLELFSFCLSVCSVVVFVLILLYVCPVCSFCVFVRILVYISPFCLSFHILYVHSQYVYLRCFHAVKCCSLICSCIVTLSLPMLYIALHYSVFVPCYFYSFFLSFFLLSLHPLFGWMQCRRSFFKGILLLTQAHQGMAEWKKKNIFVLLLKLMFMKMFLLMLSL